MAVEIQPFRVLQGWIQGYEKGGSKSEHPISLHTELIQGPSGFVDAS